MTEQDFYDDMRTKNIEKSKRVEFYTSVYLHVSINNSPVPLIMSVEYN